MTCQRAIARPVSVGRDLELTGNENVLVVGSSELSHLALHLTTEYHLRTVSVLLDCSKLDVVPVQFQFCTLGIAYNNVE